LIEEIRKVMAQTPGIPLASADRNAGFEMLTSTRDVAVKLFGSNCRFK
jgi:hypothetical protein